MDLQRTRARVLLTELFERESVKLSNLDFFISIIDKEVATSGNNPLIYHAIIIKKICDLCNKVVIKNILRKSRGEKRGMSFSEFMGMTEASIRPDLFTEVLGELKKRHEVEIDGASVENKCKVCGHNQATFSMVITRSIDEGETSVYTCKRCKSIS